MPERKRNFDVPAEAQWDADFALRELRSMIDKRKESLMKYAQLTNARQSYIDQENNLLQTLVQVYNTFKSFNYLVIWQEVEVHMAALEAHDRQICGHRIQIQTRPLGRHFSFIEVLEKPWNLSP